MFANLPVWGEIELSLVERQVDRKAKSKKEDRDHEMVIPHRNKGDDIVPTYILARNNKLASFPRF